MKNLTFIPSFSGLVLLSLSLLISVSACSISKKVNAHEQRLLTALNSNMKPEDQLDVLAASLVDMMDEGMSFLNPSKGFKFVERYGEVNGDHILTLTKSINKWQDELSTMERLAFGASLLTKPYSKQLIDLIPKFKRKYDQVVFVKRLTEGLGDLIPFRK